MASSNSGVEWGSMVKPILAASYGSFNKNDVIELAKSIVRSESELLTHDEKYRTFYTAFTALAADYISSCLTSVSKTHIGVVCKACRILLYYLLTQIKHWGYGDSSSPNNLPTKQLLFPIKALCKGVSMLPRSDQIALTAVMKNVKLPPHIKTSMPSDSVCADAKQEATKEMKVRPRTYGDLSDQILEQLTSPLLDSSPCKSFSSLDASDTKSSDTPSEKSNDVEMIFIQRNIVSLQALSAGDILIDTCLQLPHLSRYIYKYNLTKTKKSLQLPSSFSDAQATRFSLQLVVGDLNVVSNAFSLPVLEPLSPSRLEKLTVIAMACLHCALSAATAASIHSVSSAVSPKTASNSAASAANSNKSSEEDNAADLHATTVVEKALEIFNLVANVIKSSTRAGGHIYQNFVLIGAWVLICGLQAQLSTSSQIPSDKSGKEDKGKSPSKCREGSSRINLMKVQQGFGVLSVALSARALQLIGLILDDVQIESSSSSLQTTASSLEYAELSITANSTAFQRAVTILNAVSFNQFLFYLATVSYRKACTLKRIQKHPPEGDTFSTSDSTTYYDDDDMSCSDESSPDVDDDSEPLLGLWFEETVALPDSDNGSDNQVQDSQETPHKSSTDASSSIVPEKGEPHGYISLASQIFLLMNKYLVTSEVPYFTRFVESGLTEQHMIMLAAIIRDLDRETARTDTGQLYTDFSQALTRYTHNLLARNLLSEGLQSILLLHLGVNPNPANSENASWPLQVYPRTLAVLAQVLLLKPQAEKEAACICIWQRLVNTLIDNICTNSTISDGDNEDLNVEHAQLVLFLFHSLSLMQKKSVILSCANGVIKVSERVRGVMRESQILSLSRLLLLLDYLVKHLYDVPDGLLSQVQWNLLSGTAVLSENNDTSSASRMFCPWNEIEDNYRKLISHEDFSMRPRFYSLTYGEMSSEDPPKLDGLACNFILGTPEKVKYPQLLDALIDILSITDQCTPSIRVSDKISFIALCAVQYCFTVCWRLLMQLPPSTPYLEKLVQSTKTEVSPALLHSLIWGPRTAHKTYVSWMKECLHKQGMYLQYAEAAIKNVADVVNSLSYDVKMAKNVIIALSPQIETGGSTLVPKRNLPTVMDLCCLDAVIAKVYSHTELSAKAHSAEPENKTIQTIGTTMITLELLPQVLHLIEVTLACNRSSLMYHVSDLEGTAAYSNSDLIAFKSVLGICSSKCPKSQVFASSILQLLPTSVTTMLEKWNSNVVPNCSWSDFANENMAGESYFKAVVMTHISAISAHSVFTINPSLKQLLYSLVTYACDQLSKCDDGNSIFQQASIVLSPLLLDATTEYLYDVVLKVLEKSIGEAESDKHLVTLYMIILGHVYSLILNYTSSTTPCSDVVHEKILHECISWMESLLEKAPGRLALEMFFDFDKDLIQILLSISSPRMCQSVVYGSKVLQFFNKLFSIADKTPNDEGLERLCASLLRLASVESSQLNTWLNHVILGSSCKIPSSNAIEEASSSVVVLAQDATKEKSATSSSEPSSTNSAPAKDKRSLFQENQLLLQSLTSYIVKQTGENDAKEAVAVTLLEALIPLASQLISKNQGQGFAQLMNVMGSLAGAGSGAGHINLFTAASHWVQICVQKMTEEGLIPNVDGGNVAQSSAIVESCCAILKYVSEIVHALASPGPVRATSPPWEGEALITTDLDNDWIEDLNHEEDEESGGDESDEDSICNKLCTFTLTKKEFMNQHWYHCHTCKMVDGVGVCSVCAKVCHKGHDVTYAKFGNFFCDCGAKENGSCQALMKRSPQSSADATNATVVSSTANPSSMEHMLTSSLRRRPSSPTLERSQQNRETARNLALSKLLENMMEPLVSVVNKESALVGPLITLVKALQPSIEASCQLSSPVGCHLRAKASLQNLHTQDKKFVLSDQIMVPTLGSQEGAFENVRMNYSGEQGQTIRQLISAHMIRRVTMCCLASPHGKRQHLAVAHEKGKITVLQLSTLLKQADSSKRKLTLTRLSAAPIPFTVLSITSNPWNEDFLAVCGLKDCHVLTFTSGGSVGEHLVLHPQLETVNFIIRAMWVPGSQTKLALVTADFVKIYDLSLDVLTPQFYYLVPTGKIRDVTFICTEEGKSTILLMSSTGYIYTQDMDEESSSKNGSFYVTNTLEIHHSEIKESNGQLCGGGVSIYYSHALRLLFFSYSLGKSFMAPLESGQDTLSRLFVISYNKSNSPPTSSTSSSSSGGGSNKGSSNSGGSGSSSTQPQPLCLWSEVPNHPGLICSVQQASNNPVILMIKPDSVYVQEIKVVPAKAKILDMVAIRHVSSSSELRTTLILLCEDGSLRIYNADHEMTSFWLSPSIQSVGSSVTPHKPSKKKKVPKPPKSSANVAFPVDFFEHCTIMNEVDFGGNDLLQVYNAQQIKHRLNTTGMYVTSTKTAGFSVEIINNDSSLVITGIRVLVGNQDSQRVPAFMEVGGRSIPTTVTRNRWFDFPLTREESLQADKKLTVTFGPSQDPDGVTMVDSIKVYGKTKDVFGWPEETDESQATTSSNQANSNINAECEATSASTPSISLLDRMVTGILEVLDGCFTLSPLEDKNPFRSVAVNISTNFLTLPTASSIQQQAKSLLAALHSSHQSYHNYKDQAVLNYVMSTLSSLRQIKDSKDLDTEAFYRLILMTRSIAVSRPNNLLKYSHSLDSSEGGSKDHLVSQLTEIFWRLHASRPKNMALASVCIPGLTHVETIVHCLVEIVHAFTVAEHSEQMTSLAAKVYLELLLCPDIVVSFSGKHAIIRVLRPRVKRRRVFIPSPPRSSTPAVEVDKQGPLSQPSQDSSEAEPNQYDESVEPIVLLAPDPGAGAGAVSVNMEALLGSVNGGGFPPMLDIPPDADDETMVELAIALSLQDHEGGAPNIHGLVNLQALESLTSPAFQALATGQVSVSGVQNQEGGHYSDTTASAGGSDDEGSTAATDGSTLRTSPADQGGSGGSESGGSGVDSITGEHNVSGRSSAYGEQEGLVGARSETSSLGAPSGFQNQDPEGLEAESEAEPEGSTTLHSLRLATLERLVLHVPQLKTVGGVTAIPFMQVVLMLTSDLDGEEERGRACLDNLLTAVLNLLNISNPDVTNISARTPLREVQLVIMRLLSVLMSRPKSSSKTDNASFVSQATAMKLQQSWIVDYCLTLMKELIKYWKSCCTEENSLPSVNGTLLKPHLPSSPPDMSPFFLKQYVKGHAPDVFEAYPHLLTEMALRLPYQVQKHATSDTFFSQAWIHYLCEYMMTQQTPFVRRVVRKLLLFICGNKDKYRQQRDLHVIESHMKSVKECLEGSGSSQPLSYDTLVELTEHLKACVEVGSSRTSNWRQFCLIDNTVLPFLIRMSCILDEAVAQTTLQLLQCAICPTKQASTPHNPTQESSKSSNANRSAKEKAEDDIEEGQCWALVRQLNASKVPKEILTRFMKTFLLETNTSNMRWQAHSLVLAMYKNSDAAEKEVVLDQLWSLWPQLPAYGRKAAQFVDLLGYFSIKSSSSKKMSEYISQAVNMLKVQNRSLSQHPNATLYTQLTQYVDLEGYYLESDPCLVCNNPELPLTNIKLSSIKIDSKFTTTTQIVKLVSSHTISKINLRIADLKRTKMIRTMNIFYNNRSVQAVVELKNKPSMWYKAKKVTLSSGQTEVKVEFPLPIVACNLMIEYADFYENLQASSETLQCPRCNSSVPANPGVCGNCGENVFQCHKCRAINYDEKDPFLCHACGFCKYAKFDFTLTGKQCCAVDPIENDEDRKKTISSINTLLEKADRVYKQLVGNKPTLEMLLLRIIEHRSERGLDEVNNQTTNSSNSGTSAVTTNNVVMVNKAIQLLAQRYCTDCKASFEELSRIIQKVLACRKNLIIYDRAQLEQSGVGGSNNLLSCDQPSGGAANSGKCYGCVLSATEFCLILLRALAINSTTRQALCKEGLIQELVGYNLRRGSPQVQDDVRQLICLVTGDNSSATQDMCNLLMERISITLQGHLASSELAAAVRPEMNLLAALVSKEDSCWEQKLRCVVQLFLISCKEGKSPAVMDSITLPCLEILYKLIKPQLPTSKKNKDKALDSIATIKPTDGISIDVEKWLKGDLKHSYGSWSHKMPKQNSDPSSIPQPQNKAEAHAHYLEEKYFNKWRSKSSRSLKVKDNAWLRQVLFNPSSRLARQVTCNILESLCQEPSKKREILNLLTGFLSELGRAGESAAEYLALYQVLVQQPPWKQYLVLKGVLFYLADLLTSEIDSIHQLEGTSLTSDLSQGYALKMLTELMASFLEQPNIKQQYKGRLVGAVLNGYLSLRRLVVQRTRLIDETQDKLLELLEEITTGTEEETKAFMAICIDTVEKCPPQDVRTPVFVFERLCSIIYPEENDVGEFFLVLEKDPQQEEFLQGRMLGNPYSCNEPGLGPLMRDVKNKICQDCELVALLEDDNGMELLVDNKIISLDLPVKEVYKKIWLAGGGEGESMKVVYRMRGLLGDATEEFVETLHAKSQQEVNNEEVYKMANVMADCNGLKILLGRLSHIRDTVRSRPLLQVILKLLLMCAKVSKNQEVLCKPELCAINILLNILQLCVSDATHQTSKLVEQILEIMEIILTKAASKSTEDFMEFSKTLGGEGYVRSLLECSSNPNVKSNPAVLTHLARVLAALTYDSQTKMSVLMDHFGPYPMDFNKFDAEHTPDDDQKMELFCILAMGIDRSSLGSNLKDYILSLGIVEQSLKYITAHAPGTKPTLLHSDSDEWKEFISKPSLKYILRFLTGLASHHSPIQDAMTGDFITIIHRLEQVSSDEHVGSLAENLLEALRTNESAANRIEEVRGQTKAEKKRLAMAMREKQLGALGMRTNDKGQLTVDSNIMQQIEELGEETGLVCVICREGYKFQPTKVLGVYTFTKRCNIEEFETKSRKTIGYSTVTHFNVVHFECHMSAVRLARVRDEWESAALQNANTKCNGLLPLWGPQVPESAFASCLARHNTYLQESTCLRDITYSSTVHDLKLLILRFAQEKSFHDDTGGGGPQSNMHIIPYLMHMALYVINTTRSLQRDLKGLNHYFEDKGLVKYYEGEGPHYWATFSLLLQSPSEWARRRVAHLQRLIITSHIRHVSPNGPPSPPFQDIIPKPYTVYRSNLIFFGLIDLIYNYHFKKVKVPFPVEEHWPTSLADYIRHNDEALLKASERLMSSYNDELLPCASFPEFCDVVGLLEEIPNPSSFIGDTLAACV